MEDPLAEILAFVENDADWWDKAAQECEDHATELDERRGSEWGLRCAVYRERAKLHRELVAKMKQRVPNAVSHGRPVKA